MALAAGVKVVTTQSVFRRLSFLSISVGLLVVTVYTFILIEQNSRNKLTQYSVDNSRHLLEQLALAASRNQDSLQTIQSLVQQFTQHPNVTRATIYDEFGRLVADFSQHDALLQSTTYITEIVDDKGNVGGYARLYIKNSSQLPDYANIENQLYSPLQFLLALAVLMGFLFNRALLKLEYR